jgi:hypothetical protein
LGHSLALKEIKNERPATTFPNATAQPCANIGIGRDGQMPTYAAQQSRHCYSMTSSARASTVAGMSASAFAV